MSINTELSVGASNFPVLSVENPRDLVRGGSLNHTIISELWQMGKGCGSLNRREAEVTINKGRRG